MVLPAESQTPVPRLTADNFGELERLDLEQIILNGLNVNAQHIERVARFRNLKTILIDSVSATEEEIEAIRRRHPSLSIQVLP